MGSKAGSKYSRWGAVFTAGVGVLVLIGWAFHITVLKSVVPGLITMKPNTALAFCLSGAALWLLSGPVLEANRRKLVCLLGISVAVLGALNLFEYVFGVNLGIDELLFRDDPDPIGTIYPGRMAHATAACFILAGTAIVVETLPGRWLRLSQPIVLVALLPPFLALIGYAYGVPALHGIVGLTSMALNTVATFLVVLASLLFLHPDSGLPRIIRIKGPTGDFARRSIPLIIILPLVIGWFLEYWESLGFIASKSGTAIFAATLIISTMFLVMRDVVRMNRYEEAHAILERDLRDAEIRLMSGAAIKKAEDAALASTRQAGAIFEHATMGISMVGLDGRWMRVNERIAEITGYTREEMLGMKFSDITYPDDAVGDVEAIGQLVSGAIAGYKKEKRYIRKDGTIIWVAVKSGLVRDPSGEPRYIIAITDDITEKREAESRRRELEEQLNQSRKMESIGTLAGGIAHDFNNLLMGIWGNLEFLEKDILSGVDPAGRIQKIGKSVERASELTKQLLGFARKGRYNVKPVVVEGIVREVCEMFGRINRNITLDVHAEPGGFVVLADHSQMEQLLLNILLNAAQAMPEGGNIGVVIGGIDVVAGQAESRGVVPGRFIRLAISDTGMGMDAETRSRIFEPFFTTKERGKGTGLGLASAYGIAKNHGGFIDVESQPGQGTTFFIHIPASDLPVDKAEKPVSSGKTFNASILLVDDEEMVIAVTGEMLRLLGCRVIPSLGGRKALEIVRQTPDIDLVVLDMTMPDMSGAETFRAIREIAPAMKVLLASGYSIEGQAREIMEQGCNGFIQKPFNSEMLSEKLGEILRG